MLDFPSDRSSSRVGISRRECLLAGLVDAGHEVGQDRGLRAAL
jgi:hypothetical protein